MKKSLYLLATIILSLNMAYAQERKTDTNLEVGTLPGSFGVSPSGAATYSIPLGLPEGRAGMTPKLAFVYNSQTPSTIMGEGWGLSGFSSITRINPTLYYNGEVDNVDFENDQLVLDGNKLIKVSEEGGNIIYRTEIDEIAKVVYYSGSGGKDYFKVWTKAGLIKEYGTTDDSRQTSLNQTDALFWHLNKVEDRLGNYITYKYEKDPVFGELHPTEINYTWFNNGKSEQQYTYTVALLYISLDETMYQTFLFENGDLPFINKNTKMLESVSVLKGSSTHGQKLKSYLLNYKTENTLAGGYFLQEISLETIDTETGELSKLNPTLFDWSLFEPNIIKNKYDAGEFTTNQFARYLFTAFDIDGNGMDEIAEIKGEYSGTGINPNKLHIHFPNSKDREFIIDLDSDEEGEFKSLISADFTNDGRDELIVTGVTPSKSYTKVFSFSKVNDNWTYEIIWSYDGESMPMLGDVDGDGRIDLLLVSEYRGEANLFLGTGLKDDLFSNDNNPIIFSFSANDSFINIGSLSDFNGDGKADIALEKKVPNGLNDLHYVKTYSLNSNSIFDSLSFASFTNDTPQQHQGRFYFADFNGDGRTDVLFCRVPNTNIEKTVYYQTKLSYGKAFVGGATFADFDFEYDSERGSLYTIDQNNDGRTDFVYIKYNNGISENISPYITMQMFFTRPDGYFSDMLTDVVSLDAGLNYLWNLHATSFADISGNGIVAPILCIKRQSGSEKLISNPPGIYELQLIMLDDTQSEAANLITSISNGLGVSRKISYQPSRNSFVGNGEYKYPLSMFKRKTCLVQQTYLEGNQRNYLGHLSYTFNNPITMLRGKNFLGFEQIIIDNISGNIRTTTNYDYFTKEINGEDLYYIQYAKNTIVEAVVRGRVLQKLSSRNKDLNIKNTVTANKKIYIPVVTESVNKSWDLDGSFLGTSKTIRQIGDYDKWGNLKKITHLLDEEQPISNSAFNYSTVTTSSYNINEGDWLVGRPDIITSITKDKRAGDNGNKSNIRYDYVSNSSNLIKKRTIIPNDENKYKTIQEYQYDQYGNMINELISAPQFTENINGELHKQMSRSTTYIYDLSSPNYGRFLTGVLNTTINGIDYLSKISYDDITGKLENSISPASLQSLFEHDQFGRLSKTIAPDQTEINSKIVWSFKNKQAPKNALFYSNNFRVEAGTSRLMEHMEVFYDKFGRKLRELTHDFDGMYIYKDYHYEINGRLEWISEHCKSNIPFSFTKFQYDLLGRVEIKTLPFGNKLRYTYEGRETNIENIATNISITKQTDAKGRAISITDAAGTISYSYYSSGNLKSTNALGAITNLKYNAANMQTEIDEPNSGKTLYIYNAFGELISQTDARANQYIMYYDNLGRMTDKKLASTNETTHYTFNERPLRSGESGMGFGMLEEVTASNGIEYKYVYDYLNRLVENFESQSFGQGGPLRFKQSYTYDPNTGRPDTYTYPSGFKLSYNYAPNGMLRELNSLEKNNENTIWENNGTNQFGQITDFTLGNGLSTHKHYSDYGYLEQILTGRVQDLEYEFDHITGNLNWRKDVLAQHTEKFTYDDKLKSRLETWQVDNGQLFDISYTPNGNIFTKSDVTKTTSPKGIYNYNLTTKPHAVDQLTMAIPDYVSNNKKQEITYTAFNKVSTILQDKNQYRYELDFTYGPYNQRKKTILYKDRGIEKTKYFVGGNYEVEYDDLDNQRILHYIYAGDGLCAIYEWEDRHKKMYYIHKDHLGSYETITDEEGRVVEKLNFDPWGRRRNPDTWTFDNVPEETLFDRGYTGHEHLDVFGLVNMNGRVYDPWLGRMLSPDPYLQSPANSQNYNRYTYVFNNPLKFVDPSGYWGGPTNPSSNWYKDADGEYITLESNYYAINGIRSNEPYQNYDGTYSTGLSFSGMDHLAAVGIGGDLNMFSPNFIGNGGAIPESGINGSFEIVEEIVDNYTIARSKKHGILSIHYTGISIQTSVKWVPESELSDNIKREKIANLFGKHHAGFIADEKSNQLFPKEKFNINNELGKYMIGVVGVWMIGMVSQGGGALAGSIIVTVGGQELLLDMKTDNYLNNGEGMGVYVINVNAPGALPRAMLFNASDGSSIGWHHTIVKGAPEMQYHIYLKFLQELNNLR